MPETSRGWPRALRGLAISLAASLALHGLLLGALWHLPGSRRDGSAEPGAAGAPPGPGCISYYVVRHAAEPGPPLQVVDLGPETVRMTEPAGPRVEAGGQGLPARGAADSGREPGEGPAPGGPAQGGREGGGEGAGVGRLFSGSEQAESVVFLVDCSFSMGESGALAVARRELIESIRRLPAATRLQVFAYNQHVRPLRRGSYSLEPATAEVIAETVEGVKQLTASGGTSHGEALRRALLLRPECIYLVTDGVTLSWQEARALIERNGRRTVIHVVVLADQGRPDVEGILRALAESSGGTYRRVSRSRSALSRR